MKINSVSGGYDGTKLNGRQPSFQKVNEKYLKKAEEWYNSLRDDVTLFKDISPQDGVDTMMAAKKYVNEGSMGFFNHVLECIKRG